MITAAMYEADELGPGTPGGWELSAGFESSRKPVVVQSCDGDTCDDFLAAVREALG